MSKELKTFFGVVIGLAVIIVGLVVWSNRAPGKYDEFAQCITDSGTKFYGAYWCSHCAAQKALFGKSAKKLPYIECAISQTEQTQQCIDAGINGYPTWEFADKTRLSGELTFAQLAEKTGCVAPAQ